MTLVQKVRGIKAARKRQYSTYGCGIGTANRAQMFSMSAAFATYIPNIGHISGRRDRAQGFRGKFNNRELVPGAYIFHKGEGFAIPLCCPC